MSLNKLKIEKIVQHCFTYNKAARRFPALSRPYSTSFSARATKYESALLSPLEHFQWISIRNILITILRIICFCSCVLCGAYPKATFYEEKANKKVLMKLKFASWKRFWLHNTRKVVESCEVGQQSLSLVLYGRATLNTCKNLYPNGSFCNYLSNETFIFLRKENVFFPFVKVAFGGELWFLLFYLRL